MQARYSYAGNELLTAIADEYRHTQMEIHRVQAIRTRKEALEVQQRNQAMIKKLEETSGSRNIKGRKKCVPSRQYLKWFKPPQDIQGSSTCLPEGKDESKEDSPV